MLSSRIRLALGLVLGILAGGYLLLALIFYSQQRKLEYHPTHDATPSDLVPWIVNGKLFGYTLGSVSPQAVWLIFQGNDGQAGRRGYFKRVPPEDSLYIMEYPGYGKRDGEPTRDSITAAASAAYTELRRRFPGVPVGVVGESFGSGPACLLALEPVPPDSLVLIVPVARLDMVMSRFVPWLPLRILLRDNWDNVASLRGYLGPVTIYAAEKDQVIPREHTQLLAGSLPSARLIWVPGGHNDASEDAIDLPSRPPR